MKIRTKFNLLLLTVFVIGLSASGYVSHRFLNDNARAEVIRTAGFLMATAISIRKYTVDQVRPHLNAQLSNEFLPQTVPAFAATETLNHLRESYPDYEYREAVLNPTNPRDQARSWEVELIERMRSDPSDGEIVNIRETDNAKSLYIARPIKLTNPACLACHSTPEAAPASMIKKYGREAGFGWKLDEVIGAQLVSVPMSIPLQSARDSFVKFMTITLVVFLLVLLALNLVLGGYVVKPMIKISEIANKISKGDFNIPEFSSERKDEVGDLENSFNRMRRSLQKAISMIG